MSRVVRTRALSRMAPGESFAVLAASVFGVVAAACARDIRVLESKDAGTKTRTPDASRPNGCIRVACSGTQLWDDTRCACVDNFQTRCSPITCPLGGTQDPASCACVYANCVPASCDGGNWNQSTCSCEYATGACANSRTRYEISYTGKNGSTLRLESMPQMPMVGDDQTWSMSITMSDGQPVPQGTSVSVVCKMIHANFTHGCPADIHVTRDVDAFTASPVIFNMQGDWQLTVQVGNLDTFTFGFCAQ